MLLYKDIVKEGNEVLRQKSSDCSIPLSAEELDAVIKMNEYLENGYDEEFCKTHEIRPGVGLAAPQIGLSKKIICIYAYDDNATLYNLCLINPKIMSHSEELTYLETGEGCLSVEEDHQGYIHRYRRVKVKAKCFNFDTKTLEDVVIQFKGYLAIIFQHEFDHLNGILFFDRINKVNPFYVPENSTPVIFKND